MPRLHCFDFDKSWVKGHFHNALQGRADAIPETLRGDFKPVPTNKQKFKNKSSDEIAAVKEQAQKLLNHEQTGIKNKKELQAKIKEIIEKGDKLAIVSYSFFPEAIEMTLRETLKGMIINGKPVDPDDFLKNHVVIEAGFPEGKMEEVGKLEHIERAKESWKKKGVTVDEKVALYDDDRQNRQTAEAAGHVAIEISPEPNAEPTYLAPGIAEQKFAEKEKGDQPMNESQIMEELFKCIKSKDLEQFDTYLREEDIQDIDALNAKGQTLLHAIAASSKNSQFLGILLGARTVNCNATDKDGWTPLQIALLNGCLEQVKEYLEYDDNNDEVINWTVKTPDGKSMSELANSLEKTLREQGEKYKPKELKEIQETIRKKVDSANRPRP